MHGNAEPTDAGAADVAEARRRQLNCASGLLELPSRPAGQAIRSRSFAVHFPGVRTRETDGLVVSVLASSRRLTNAFTRESRANPSASLGRFRIAGRPQLIEGAPYREVDEMHGIESRKHERTKWVKDVPPEFWERRFMENRTAQTRGLAAAIVPAEATDYRFRGPTIIGTESRVKPRGPGIPVSDRQRPTGFGARPLARAFSAPKDAYAVRYFGRSHQRAQCRWLWHRRLRRIRVEKPSEAGLPLLPRAAILKALVGPADTMWWATL